MPRKPANGIVRAVTDLLWERDRLQMQAVDALSSAIERKRRHSSRRAAQKHRRRSKGTT
jgi:hypothetical protein